MTAQPYGPKKESRGQSQPGPQTRRAEKMGGNESRHHIHRGTARRHGGGILWACHAVLQQGQEMRSIECNRLHSADTNGGRKAHINGARGAQAETSSSQP
jgi:hypothetical protein